MAGLFLLEVVAILVVANSRFLPGEFTTFQKQYNDIKPVLSQNPIGQVASIFTNNFRVATAELIPGFGPLLFAFSIYETARIVEVIGLSGTGGVAGALATLFLLPSTWLELPAYAIAVTESLYMLFALFSILTSGRRALANFGHEVLILFLNLFMIAGVLIVAATVEVTEIQLESSPIPALALLTWIPAAGILLFVLRFWRRARREAPLIEEKEAGFTAAPDAPQEGAPAGPPPADGGTLT